MNPKNSETLTSRPTKGRADRSPGVKGPRKKPGRHAKPAGRVTRAAYEAGLRVDEPPKKRRQTG